MARGVGAVLILSAVLSSCAQHQAQPHTSPTAQAPVPIPVAVVETPPPPPAAIVAHLTVKQDSNPVPLKIAKDSLADVAALAALDNTSALNALPDIAIPDGKSLDLNAAAFASQPRVQFFVDYFTGRSRDRFQVWLNRIPEFETLIRTQLAENKLPADLLYLALIESGYSPTAVSSASAVGMWQFMTGTGQKYGLRVDGWVDERRDPVKSTVAAAHHLRDLTDMFGSYYLAAAAYNAGAGKVGRGLTRLNKMPAADIAEDSTVDLSSGVDFFSLADTRLLQQETKDYIPKLIAATLIAKNPARYGFDHVIADPPFSLDSVMVDGGTGLDLIARLAGTTLDVMRELNPNLLRLVAPPNTKSYPVRVPTGTADSVAQQYAALAPAERLALVSYKVKVGETLASIAKSTDTPAEDIKAINRAARLGIKIPVGSTLYLPHTTIPLALLRDVGSSTISLTHTVKAGETIGGIARQYGVTVASIRSSNHMTQRGVIRVGQKLTVAARPDLAITSTASAATSAASGGGALPRNPNAGAGSVVAKIVPPSTAVPTRSYTVRAGDTISSIAMMYGVNQAQLVSLNKLGAAKKIVIGQKLKIPA